MRREWADRLESSRLFFGPSIRASFRMCQDATDSLTQLAEDKGAGLMEKDGGDEPRLPVTVVNHIYDEARTPRVCRWRGMKGCISP